MVANFILQETLIVPKATILGIAEDVSEPLVEKINANSDSPPYCAGRKGMKLLPEAPAE
jgi:hypothetical protein